MIKPRSSSVCLFKRCYSNEKGGKAMTERLQQLAENAPVSKHDPKAGGRDENPLIEEMYNRIKYSTPPNIFYAKELGKGIPTYASKETEEIARGDVWIGEETAEQVAKRLALDKKEKQLQSSVQMPKYYKRSRNDQLSQGREKALDYKIDKFDKNGKNEKVKDPNIKEMYLEKYMMASGASDALSITNSIANQRIEDAVERGQFKNLPRGKKAEYDHHASSPYIDTTEYFLNKMIKKQKAAPPWVESQMRVHEEIENLKRRLRVDWIQNAVKVLDQRTQGLSIKNRLKSAVLTKQDQREWETKQKLYHELLIREINNIIRGYNIQAPPSARRGYLFLDEELENCCKSSVDEIKREFERHLKGTEVPKVTTPLQSKKRNEIVSENPDNYYGFKHLIRDMFSRSRSRDDRV